MKILKLLQSVFALIPFLWFTLFLTILIIGTINVGFVPTYGINTDPSSLSIGILLILHSFAAIFGLLAFFGWIFITLISLLINKKNAFFGSTYNILFYIGIIGFFVFKYIFPQVFAWVVD